MIRVSVDYARALRGLQGIEREQMPFAYAKTLLDVAKTAANAVKRETRSRFKLHGEFIPRGILVEPFRVGAIKRNIKQYGLAQVAIMSSRAITPFMAIHEKGGTKRPVKGRKVISVVTKKWREENTTASGALKRGARPAALLKYYNTHKGSAKRQSKGAIMRPFKLGGSIVQRTPGSQYGRRVLFHFVGSAKIKARWGFEPTTRSVVEHVWAPTFEHNFAQAMATARLRNG